VHVVQVRKNWRMDRRALLSPTRSCSETKENVMASRLARDGGDSKTTIEFGYIGRKYTHDLQAININAVPYMMTLGGQTFAQAFGQMAWQYCAGASFPQNQKNLAGGNCVANLAAVTEQPFFKAALKPAYRASTGGNCAQAVAANEGGNK